MDVDLGARVEKGDRLGNITDAFGSRPSRISSTATGHVIAMRHNPLVVQGDALYHIGLPPS